MGSNPTFDIMKVNVFINFVFGCSRIRIRVNSGDLH